MKITHLLSLLFAFVLVGFVGNTARADHWDNHGWTKLGEREVNGRVDHDTIVVGGRHDKFRSLTIVCENSDLELLDLEVTFGNGEHFHPEVRHVFKEGSRSRQIDFPGDLREVKEINLKYKNFPGGGKARVEVYGRR